MTKSVLQDRCCLILKLLPVATLIIRLLGSEKFRQALQTLRWRLKQCGFSVRGVATGCTEDMTRTSFRFLVLQKPVLMHALS